MAQAYDRRLQVADLLKHELGKLLLSKSHDPRFSFVSIASIEIAKDYSTAKVYVTLLNESHIKDVVKALNKAAGFFRYQLAQQVNLRTTPKLHFYYDDTLAKGQRISDLLAKQKPTKEE